MNNGEGTVQVDFGEMAKGHKAVEDRLPKFTANRVSFESATAELLSKNGWESKAAEIFRTATNEFANVMKRTEDDLESIREGLDTTGRAYVKTSGSASEKAANLAQGLNY